jgi:hypothetical protein
MTRPKGSKNKTFKPEELELYVPPEKIPTERSIAKKNKLDKLLKDLNADEGSPLAYILSMGHTDDMVFIGSHNADGSMFGSEENKDDDEEVGRRENELDSIIDKWVDDEQETNAIMQRHRKAEIDADNLIEPWQSALKSGTYFRTRMLQFVHEKRGKTWYYVCPNLVIHDFEYSKAGEFTFIGELLDGHPDFQGYPDMNEGTNKRFARLFGIHFPQNGVIVCLHLWNVAEKLTLENFEQEKLAILKN